VGKHKGKRPLKRSRKRWNYNIEMCVCVKQIGLEEVDWIHLAEFNSKWRAAVI